MNFRSGTVQGNQPSNTEANADNNSFYQGMGFKRTFCVA